MYNFDIYLNSTVAMRTVMADKIGIKDIEILAIILVPLIMTHSRGSYWADQRTVIMR